MYRRNASATTADPTATTELVLFATNDGDLYAGQGQSIIANLSKKMANGQYDTAKAAKLWGYFADSAAQKYAWEFGSRKPGTRSWHQQGKDGNGMFNAATRRMAASEIEASFREEVQDKAASIKPARSARKNGGKVTMASIRAANKAAGGHWFSRGTNKFFGSKVVAGPYGGRFFVTAEKSGFDERSPIRYTVREAVDGGEEIKTVGEFNGFMFKEDAVDMARAMAASSAGAASINASIRALRSNGTTAYNVYLRGKLIDTVFQSGVSSADEVRRSLIGHDGYDPAIRVTKAARAR
jgi:hypothetical protein